MNEPEHLAREVREARQRLLGFVQTCTDRQWTSRPLGDADPRSVAVIVDHVADAYEYIARWMAGLVVHEPVEVDAGIVDELNARHAGAVTTPTREQVGAHLSDSGDRLIELISSLRPDQLALGDGGVGRLARIAALHADGHRTEFEEAWALPEVSDPLS